MPADAPEQGRPAVRPRSPIAAAAVPQMYGYRMPPMPGVHRGLPSPYLTLVFSLSGPLPIEIPTGERVRSEAFAIPVGGLHTRAVLLPQETSTPGRRPADQRGIQVAVHPLAARALFGLPAGELTEQVWELDDVVGGGTDQLRECLAGSADGRDAMALVAGWIDRRLSIVPAGHPAPELERAWRLIVGSGGRRRISDVASEVGWSRRHLTTRMRAETGLGAKDLARVTRFHRSRSMLGSARAPLAAIAAECGYADQSHLTAEWREFAGCTPGRWITDELPYLTGDHDGGHEPDLAGSG